MDHINIMPPPGLAPLPSKPSRKPRRECALLENYIISGSENKICILSRSSRETIEIPVHRKLGTIIDIDFNKELIAILDTNGTLIIIQYNQKDTQIPIFNLVGYAMTDLDQIYLCKMSNILYGSKGAEYLLRFNIPATKLMEHEKIRLNKSFLCTDSDGNVVYTIAELGVFGDKIAIFATSDHVLPAVENVLPINPGEELPLALEYLPEIKSVLSITDKAIRIIDCITKAQAEYYTTFQEKPYLADVPEEKFIVCLSNFVLYVIGYENGIKLQQLEEIGRRKPIATISAVPYKPMDSIHILVSYGGNDYSDHTFSISTIKQTIEETSEVILQKNIEEQFDKKYDEMIESKLSLLERDLVADLGTKMEAKVAATIDEEVARHMKSIEDTLTSNLPAYVDKCIDHEKINAQIKFVHGTLQENLIFAMQKGFIPAFEDSCNKMFKELSKIHKEGLGVFKQKMESEESATKDLKVISNAHIKKNIDLFTKIETVIHRQTDLIQKCEDLPKSIPDAPPAIISKPASDRVPEEEPELPPKLAEAFPTLQPLKSAPPTKTPIEGFRLALEARNPQKAIKIASEHFLDENCLLEFLDKSEGRVLKELAVNGKVNQKYVRQRLLPILKYFSQNRAQVNSKMVELLIKAGELLVPTMEGYDEYQTVRTMLFNLISWANPMYQLIHILNRFKTLKLRLTVFFQRPLLDQQHQYNTSNSVSIASSSLPNESNASANAVVGLVVLLVCTLSSILFSRGCGILYPAKSTFGFVKRFLLGLCQHNKWYIFIMFPAVWSSRQIVNVPAFSICVSSLNSILYCINAKEATCSYPWVG
eukprot:TRINITY_DN1326_c0_g2_i1.p1 TRINITY_DN1326_c0_g2~~TRINITY_DN1326_c0_g2_i1.p1  ORF type:complete len:851 (-),score=62.22 TRINITY_DN1326_c0_g2_i1:6158-8617(-)